MGLIFAPALAALCAPGVTTTKAKESIRQAQEPTSQGQRPFKISDYRVGLCFASLVSPPSPDKSGLMNSLTS